MTTSSFNFQRWLESALLNIIKQTFSTLEKLQNTEIHSFYITFITSDPRVKIPKFLQEQYPNDLTIVLEHQFENFKVINNGFAVTLFFSGQPADIFCPFDCMIKFYDKATNTQFPLPYIPAKAEPVATHSKPVLKKDAPLTTTKNTTKKKNDVTKENSNIITFKPMD